MNNKGYSLIELLVSIFLVSFVVMFFSLLFGTAFRGCLLSSQIHQHAVEEANQWVNEVFTPEEASTARVSCQATDSDGNGYVSCTLNMTRNGEEQLIPIECHAYVWLNYGDTCRPLVPLTMGMRR